jgi:heat shock protein HslJ
MHRIIPSVVGCAILCLGGCGLARPGSESAATTPLAGTSWAAKHIDGAGVIDNAQLTLVFGTDKRVSGHAGCNQYGGRVTLNGASMQVDEVFATLMACVKPALMEQESRYLAALRATRSYRMDGTKLVLLDGSGKARLTFDR